MVTARSGCSLRSAPLPQECKGTGKGSPRMELSPEGRRWMPGFRGWWERSHATTWNATPFLSSEHFCQLLLLLPPVLR